jgi:hypothetical protein
MACRSRNRDEFDGTVVSAAVEMNSILAGLIWSERHVQRRVFASWEWLPGGESRVHFQLFSEVLVAPVQEGGPWFWITRAGVVALTLIGKLATATGVLELSPASRLADWVHPTGAA